MTHRSRPVGLAVLLLGLAAAPAAAQDGFALKGSYIYNRAAVEEARELPAVAGFSVGAEYVLPLGLGLGVAAYTGGRLSEFDRDATTATALAEANYFLRLPLLPVAPYAGVHAGLGTYTRQDLNDPEAPRIRDDVRQYGYQLGVRVQLTRMLGLDAQYRRVSTSLQEEQDRRFSRDQLWLGLTLF